MSTVEANETSPRKFVKPWGTQTVVHSNRDFETHLIEIKQGGKTSIHVHRGKHNGWFVIEGEVAIEEYDDTPSVTNCKILKAGDKYFIPNNVVNSFRGITDAKMIEFFWQEISFYDKDELVGHDKSKEIE